MNPFSVMGTDTAAKVTTSDCGMIAVHATSTPTDSRPISPESAASESFTGTAATSGTFKRPLLDVNGTRYELQAADSTATSVSEMLKKSSEGDTGRYVIKGTRATVNGKDGIVIESITPADEALPSTSSTSPPRSLAHVDEPTAPDQAAPAVTSSLRTVGSNRYTVYDYHDGATRAYAVVIPEGLTTIRVCQPGILIWGWNPVQSDVLCS